MLILRIVADAGIAGRQPAPDGVPMPRAVRADLRALRDAVAPQLAERQLAAAVMAWTQLIGSISFELRGHLNVIHDYADDFDYQMRVVGERLGLTERRLVR